MYSTFEKYSHGSGYCRIFLVSCRSIRQYLPGLAAKQPWSVWINGSHDSTRNSRYNYKKKILSWSWLNIWFEPMRWLVSGHVTGINTATTTCQPRPANHDLCFLGFWTNQKDIFIASICIKMKRLESYWYENSYFIHILDKKTIQNVILSTGWHLISFKNFHCYVLLKFYKQCWKCT